MDPKDLRDGYDRSAPRYEERFEALQRPKLDAVLARVLRLARARRGLAQDDREVLGRVLDVGCGTGLLAARVPGAIGLDLSLEMLRRGRGVRVQGDALALPFRDACFETAFVVTALFEPLRGLVELRRVLVPGGALAFTMLRADVPARFEEDLRAAGFVLRERFECGQDTGWAAERR